MLFETLDLLLQSQVTKKAFAWLYHLGAPGLILLGIVDSSVIPIPGSIDALTIVLAAHHRSLWPLYASMATVGSVLGAYFTYRLAKKEGKEQLEKRLSQKHAKAIFSAFKRWGFGTISISAIMPPPMPMVPVVVAAGATGYSSRKFLGAMTLGRVVRYGLLAYFAARYGRQILKLFSEYGYDILYAFVALAVLSVSLALVQHFRHRHKSDKRER